jgi:hypothetical protein
MKNSKRIWSNQERMQRGLGMAYWPRKVQEARELRREELWAKVVHRDVVVRCGNRRDRHQARLVCRGFYGE